MRHGQLLMVDDTPLALGRRVTLRDFEKKAAAKADNETVAALQQAAPVAWVPSIFDGAQDQDLKHPASPTYESDVALRVRLFGECPHCKKQGTNGWLLTDVERGYQLVGHVSGKTLTRFHCHEAEEAFAGPGDDDDDDDDDEDDAEDAFVRLSSSERQDVLNAQCRKLVDKLPLKRPMVYDSTKLDVDLSLQPGRVWFAHSDPAVDWGVDLAKQVKATADSMCDYMISGESGYTEREYKSYLSVAAAIGDVGATAWARGAKAKRFGTMQAPTDQEVRDYYRDAALGRVTDIRRKAFEARLTLRNSGEVTRALFT